MTQPEHIVMHSIDIDKINIPICNYKYLYITSQRDGYVDIKNEKISNYLYIRIFLLYVVRGYFVEVNF